MLHMDAVHADEAMAEIVEAHPELRPAIGDFEFPGVGPEAHVRPRFHGVGVSRTVDFSARQPAGDIDPVVGAEYRMADAKLTGIAGVEAGENNLAHIRVAITLSILQINNVGGAGDENATAPRHDAVGEGEAVGEDGAFVVTTIAVG